MILRQFLLTAKYCVIWVSWNEQVTIDLDEVNASVHVYFQINFHPTATHWPTLHSFLKVLPCPSHVYFFSLLFSIIFIDSKCQEIQMRISDFCCFLVFLQLETDGEFTGDGRYRLKCIKKPEDAGGDPVFYLKDPKSKVIRNVNWHKDKFSGWKEFLLVIVFE